MSNSFGVSARSPPTVPGSPPIISGGAAQTWYYALEQDEGMPPWERFKELCRLRFSPPIRGSRLAELGRLPFVSTVQEFADRF